MEKTGFSNESVKPNLWNTSLVEKYLQPMFRKNND